MPLILSMSETQKNVSINIWPMVKTLRYCWLTLILFEILLFRLPKILTKLIGLFMGLFHRRQLFLNLTHSIASKQRWDRATIFGQVNEESIYHTSTTRGNTSWLVLIHIPTCLGVGVFPVRSNLKAVCSTNKSYLTTISHSNNASRVEKYIDSLKPNLQWVLKVHYSVTSGEKIHQVSTIQQFENYVIIEYLNPIIGPRLQF